MSKAVKTSVLFTKVNTKLLYISDIVCTSDLELVNIPLVLTISVALLFSLIIPLAILLLSCVSNADNASITAARVLPVAIPCVSIALATSVNIELNIASTIRVSVAVFNSFTVPIDKVYLLLFSTIVTSSFIVDTKELFLLAISKAVAASIILI